MERTEAAGFGVALLLHGALIAILSLAVNNRLESPPPAMEVSFVEESATPALETTSTEEAAPSVGEELGAPEEAAADAVPEPAPQPEVQPVPQPAPSPRPAPTPAPRAERPRPAATPVPVRPPVQRPVRVAEARPQPAARRPAQPQPRPSNAQGQGQAQRSRGSVLDRLSREFGRGPATAQGSSPQPAARLSGAQQQQLARNISGLIQPCAARATPPNGLARSISVDLRVTVNQNGSPASHQLVGSSGTNDSNETYIGAVVDVAMRAVRACSSRIASLPDDHYGVPGGWRTFRYRFRFPG